MLNKEKHLIITFIGSFNPPTNGHLHAMALAKNYLTNLGFIVDKVIIVPANSSYNKPGLYSGEIRYEMCKLMINNVDYIEIDDFEVKQTEWKPTLFTLLHLQEKYPNNHILLLCGIDVIESFDKYWNHEYAIRILEEFGLCVLPREKKVENIELLSKLVVGRTQNIIIVDYNPLEKVSSTLIRNLISEKKHLTGLVHPLVEKYLIDKKLYQ